MKRKLYYWVYETLVESDFAILNIPTVSETDSVPDVAIRISKDASGHIPEGKYGTYYSPDVCALSSFWGTLEVSHGNLIQVYCNPGYDTSDASPFIIGWGFGFLFNQRGYSVFHCAALNVEQRGVIVSGVSGAGKSSTALSLIRSGAAYLADDMAIMNPAESLDLIPAYPIQKVCRDMSLELNHDDLQHISEGRDKFSYHNEKDYCSQRITASHLVLLRLHDGDEVLVTEYKGIDKWMKVLSCLYLNDLFASFGLPPKDQKNCLSLAHGMRVLEISRPRDKDTSDQITGIILDFVHS